VRRIALVDKTSEHKPEPGVLEAIAEAITIQVERDFAPAWGIAARPVRVGGGGDKVNLLDSPEQAAAEYGWHSVDDDGLPYAHVFVATCKETGSDWLTGDESVAATIGHEVLEMLVDPCANEYAFNGYRRLWASEVCDPVQASSYRIRAGGKQVPVTNFVLPAFFNAWAAGPYDHLGVLDAPFSIAKGGYAVCQKAGRVRELLGRRKFTVEFDPAMPKARREAKLRGFGRTYWRKALHP
jgi:hypothetical protein